MRLTVAAVGRMRDGPMAALYADYAGRLPWPVATVEVEERRNLPPEQRRAAEGKRLAARLPAGATLVALDERGKALASADFTRRIADWRDRGVSDLAFVIGGADGLDPGLRDRANLVLSLGAMTWPHLLARVMLVEQLYRASAILSGHPYHRG